VSQLAPSVIGAIDDLELAARLIVDGLRSGQHRSPLHGFSTEFSQHRPYRTGDDLKHLDWKILARTDRLYSKQFRETTNMAVMIVLDTSASMAFPASGLSKFRYASVVAASLAYLIVNQGDAVGLMTMESGKLAYVPAKGGRPHLRTLIAQLERLQPGGIWEPPRAIARGAELLKRRGVVIAISDFYDEEDATRRELRRAARRGHDVAMLQVISPMEIALPFRGDLEFEDLESGERRLMDVGEIARAYRSAVGDFLERSRGLARRDGIDYALFRTDAAPGQALRHYLLRRGGRHQPRHAAREEPA